MQVEREVIFQSLNYRQLADEFDETPRQERVEETCIKDGQSTKGNECWITGKSNNL
jgi:hypothetical protein